MFRSYRESYTGKTVTPMTRKVFGIRVGYGPAGMFSGRDQRDHWPADPEHAEHRTPDEIRRDRDVA